MHNSNLKKYLYLNGVCTQSELSHVKTGWTFHAQREAEPDECMERALSNRVNPDFSHRFLGLWSCFLGGPVESQAPKGSRGLYSVAFFLLPPWFWYKVHAIFLFSLSFTLLLVFLWLNETSKIRGLQLVFSVVCSHLDRSTSCFYSAVWNMHANWVSRVAIKHIGCDVTKLEWARYQFYMKTNEIKWKHIFA